MCRAYAGHIVRHVRVSCKNAAIDGTSRLNTTTSLYSKRRRDRWQDIRRKADRCEKDIEAVAAIPAANANVTDAPSESRLTRTSEAGALIR